MKLCHVNVFITNLFFLNVFPFCALMFNARAKSSDYKFDEYSTIVYQYASLCDVKIRTF